MTFNYVSHTMLQYTVNKLLALINAIDTSGSGGSGVTAEDLAAKEDAMEIVNNTSSTLSLAVGKYYKAPDSYNFNTCTFTLPSMNTTKVQGIMMRFKTGASPNMTVNSAGSQTIKYADGFQLEANSVYELNFLWNGVEWLISYGKFS